MANMPVTSEVAIYFSDYFEIDPATLESYGAFNVSLVNDLPLFVDPFLLFDSENEKYRTLHEQIIEYLRFLRDVSEDGMLDQANIDQWFYFKEVKQNWLGFSKTGNGGNGLGQKFAKDLHQSLHLVFRDFGNESITKSSHLEKVCLFGDGVGKDHLSDFTTNLVKEFLLDYTQTFALQHLREDQRRRVAVPKVRFNYQTRRWSSGVFELPYIAGDHIILTPRDILTRDSAWINRQELLGDLEDICQAIPNDQLRAQINSYFVAKLGDDPSKQEMRDAAAATVTKFPEIIDHYIRLKEENASEAHAQSSRKVIETQVQFVDQVKAFVRDHLAGTEFYHQGDTYAESMARVQFLKHVIEDNDGWRFFYVKGVPIKLEEHLQLLYRLTWFATPLDVNREVNNGRGPVDYKVSNGSKSKTLIEFKLAKNKKLKANLQYQVPTYEQANNTQLSITVIMYFNDSEHERVQSILSALKLSTAKNIVLIDARSGKPSASLLK
jgi:hypothetical protein